MKEIIYDARSIDLRRLEELNYKQCRELMSLWQETKALSMMKAEITRLTKELNEAHEENKELKKKKDNVVPFLRLATNTGGPVITGGWLSNLEEGCVFITHKGSDEEVEQWHLMIKWEKSCLLFKNMPPREGETYKLVHYELFSAKNRLVEVLGKPEVEDAE